jgi:hypothetical protein
LPTLYLHGLAPGDFELALRGLLGDGAPLSRSSLQRLRGKWDTEYEAWRGRALRDRELVYLWADGLYVKAGREKDKAAVLVVIGALRDGSKEILAVESGVRLRTDAAKRYKQVANATALIWKVLLVAESRFRRLDAPELLTEVYHGVTYVDGRRAIAERKRRVAA